MAATRVARLGEVHRFGIVLQEVVPPVIPDDDPFEGDAPIEPGWDVPIASFFTHPGATARYAYDFGDGWQHRVTLEAIRSRRRGQRYPVCLGGKRACPPEDCGGPHGYERVLAIARDADHPEHEETVQWLGGRFDPERFRPARVKFDDPRKRWRLAFATKPSPPRRGRTRSPGRSSTSLAGDGSQQLAALVREPGEWLEQLLSRLDAAIDKAWQQGFFTDEPDA